MFDDFFEEVFCDIEDKVISPPEQFNLHSLHRGTPG